MTEADLKRALLASLKAQGGYGFRNEDKYLIGHPDLTALPPLPLPVFFLEAKLVAGAKLVCTPIQARALLLLNRPPQAHAVLIGYSAKRERLYLGHPEQPLERCPFIMRPDRLHSNEWLITALLKCWHQRWQKDYLARGFARG